VCLPLKAAYNDLSGQLTGEERTLLSLGPGFVAQPQTIRPSRQVLDRIHAQVEEYVRGLYHYSEKAKRRAEELASQTVSTMPVTVKRNDPVAEEVRRGERGAALRARRFYNAGEMAKHAGQVQGKPLPSTWQAFLDALQQHVTQQGNRFSRRNMSPSEVAGLKSLRARKDILVVPSDKSKGFVVQLPTDYVDACELLLSDREVYKPLGRVACLEVPKAQKRELTEELKEILEARRQVLRGPLRRVLAEINLWAEARHYYAEISVGDGLANFYGLSKDHKKKRPPPVRPVVNQIGSVSYRSSQLVHYLLEPLLARIPNLVMRPATLGHRLRARVVPAGTIIASLDIESLYTNIPHESGVAAITWFLQRCWGVAREALQAALPSLIREILLSNVFEFNGEAYIQVKELSTVCGV